MSSSYDTDPRLSGASAQRGLIPPKEHLEIDQSAIPGIAGMLLPFEFIYTLSFILSLNVNMALVSFIITFATLLAGYIYPAQKRVQAKDRPGIPVRERNQLGPHLWEEQNRYIAVTPAVRPITDMDVGSIFSIFEERDLSIERGGTVIIEGLPIDPDAIRKARDMLAEASDEAEDSEVINLTRKGVFALLNKIWAITKETYTMIMNNKWWFIGGGLIAFVVYLFSPLWLQWWDILVTMIGW
jgi:hypothetical protein